MMIGGDEHRIRMNGQVYHCALVVTMDPVGGKWKTIVLRYLRKDKQRLPELRRHIPASRRRCSACSSVNWRRTAS